MSLWRGRPTPARRAAAAAILTEPVSATTAPSAATDSEIEAMRALVGILADLPPEAWPEGAVTTLVRRPRRVRGSGARRLVTAALAATCLALGFLAGTVTHRTHGASPPDGPGIVLRPLAPASGTGLAVAYMTAPEQMQLRVVRLAPSPPGTYYELWLMTSPTHLSPVAAFRIDASGKATLDLRLPDDPSHYAYLDISRQRLGAGNGISSDSLLRGDLA